MDTTLNNTDFQSIHANTDSYYENPRDQPVEGSVSSYTDVAQNGAAEPSHSEPTKKRTDMTRLSDPSLPHSFISALPSEQSSEIPDTRTKLRWSEVINPPLDHFYSFNPLTRRNQFWSVKHTQKKNMNGAIPTLTQSPSRLYMN